jgi:hypothetical protein
MNYFLLTNKILVTEDNPQPAQPISLILKSHDMVQTKTGHFLVDYELDMDAGAPFVGPLLCEADREDPSDFWPAIFLSPALIAHKSFVATLQAAGVQNIELHTVNIADPTTNSTNQDYLLVNVIGRVACAHMGQSEYNQLGQDEEDMRLMTHLVIEESKTGDFDMFLLDEDTDCILMSERLVKHFDNQVYAGVYFEPVDVV